MGVRKILLGNEAIAYGLVKSGCRVATSYPGTPASEILATVLRLKEENELNGVYAEWSVNEKVAFETALAASYSGLRSAVMMKQVGLNVASDALMSAAYTGVKGGFVVISADDPGPHSSQTEQDSRFFAMFAKIPVFDPVSPEDAKLVIDEAFRLSEKYEIPVMVRPTTRVCHARQDVLLEKLIDTSLNPSFEKNPSRWAATPKFRFLLHKELNHKLEKIAHEKDDDFDSKVKEKCIIASGIAWANAAEVLNELNLEDEISLLRIKRPFPLSVSLVNLLKEAKDILVLEETYPVIEYQLSSKCCGKVSGRLTGIVPSEGELLPEVIETIVSKWAGVSKAEDLPRPEEALPRRPTLCPGCGHRPVFFAIRKVFKKGIFPGDIGCYTLGLNLEAVDTVLCMGASVAQAAGFYRAFKMASDGKDIPPVVATIGDSTFFHAGIPPLINAVVQGAKFVLVILDNSTTAMTGHQPAPHVLSNGKVSIEGIVKACGVEFIKAVDPYNLPSLIEALEEARSYAIDEAKGIAVVIARRPCIMDRRAGDSFKKVSVFVSDDCTGCLFCVQKFECPAIIPVAKNEPIKIDNVLCVGCGVCVDVCPYGAIGVEK